MNLKSHLPKNPRMRRLLGAASFIGVGSIVLAACGGSGNTSITRDQKVSTQILNQLQKAQPVPEFKWSQYRQTLIDIETAQADGSQTTTFFFDPGTTAPISSCPSLGFPVASTSELTNPSQIVEDPYAQGGTSVPIPQIDPNGIYAGNSSGTYVICINPDGSTYAQYWEGFTDAVSGPAIWNSKTNSIEMTGKSTTVFHTKANH